MILCGNGSFLTAAGTISWGGSACVREEDSSRKKNPLNTVRAAANISSPGTMWTCTRVWKCGSVDSRKLCGPPLKPTPHPPQAAAINWDGWCGEPTINWRARNKLGSTPVNWRTCNLEPKMFQKNSKINFRMDMEIRESFHPIQLSFPRNTKKRKHALQPLKCKSQTFLGNFEE